MAPFRPWLRYTGTEQAWQMFVAPHRHPTRMQLQVHKPGTEEEGWETVFEERSETYTWRAERFSSERLRASIFRWGWPNYQTAWKQACKVFADELFVERADIDQVRCRMFRRSSPSPEQVRSGSPDPGKWTYVLVHQRDPQP